MAETIFKLPKLKGSSNYDIWVIRIESLLVEKGYLSVIENDTSNVEELKDLANKATALIKLSLEDSPLLQTRTILNPYVLWHTLRDLYEPKGFSSDFNLSKDLINTTLNSFKGNLESYVNSFKRIVDSLSARSINLPNKFLVALLLNNLNKDYEYVVAIITQTIRLEPNKEIDINNIISQLLDESRRIKGKNKNYNNATSSSYSSSSSSKKPNSSYTNNVEMSMQTKATKKPKKPNKDKLCSYCNLKGHVEANCYKKQNAKNKAISSTTESIEAKETVLNSFKSTTSSSIDFILDSSATIHTCYIKDLFTSLRPTTTTIK